MRQVFRVIGLLLLRTVLTIVWGCLRLTELFIGNVAKWLQEVIHVHTKL